MQPIISVSNVSKTYASGLRALERVNLDIRRGEIFALLGPNGAGKTTLISIICGIVTLTEGTVSVAGYDIGRDYRVTRSMIGLVPQELTTDSVMILLSGGMKRRVLIAKALSHEPQILFLDEPTAGVDVELRKDMWDIVRALRAEGVTIILTTHYIEEAEEMADRIGVMHRGKIILVEDKVELMRKLGKKQLTLHLQKRLDALPDALAAHRLTLAAEGSEIV